VNTTQRASVVTTQILGVRVVLTVVVNRDEWRRRADTRCAAITRTDVLDALLGLPLGIPVAVADLTDRERQAVNRLPNSLVQHRGYDVIRRVERVVNVKHAAVKAREWRGGLAQAGRFAPWCSRSIVLSTRPTNEAEAAMQASYYGIGIVVETGTGRVTLVEPEPWVNHRVTPAGWWFTEEVYEQMTSTKSSPVTPTTDH
jgi:hypothetical protein